MTEIVALIPKDGAWVILIVVVLLVLGPVSIFSKNTILEKFSGLGVIVRWVRNRHLRAVEMQKQQESVTVAMLEDQIAAVRKGMTEQQANHDGDMEAMRQRLDDSEKREANMLEYVLWTTHWARNIIVWAAEHGHELPPPAWKSYRDWLDQQRKNLDD